MIDLQAAISGLIFFDGFESPIHMSIIFAYSWSSQISILAEISPI